MKTKASFNRYRIAAGVLLALVALNALAAGYSFISDPSGKGLGIATTYLKPSAPFRNYLIPGIILFGVIGVGSCVVAVLTIVRYRHYPLLLSLHGCVLMGWIAVQLTMVTNLHPLHIIVGAVGTVLFIIGQVLKKEKSTLRTSVA